MATSRPRNDRTDVTVDATRALGQFGLDPSAVESVRPLVSGVGRHHGLRVRADGREWVLKGHSSRRAIDRLAISHALELGLADEGFPVAELRRTASGLTLVAGEHAHYDLHGWVDGDQQAIADRDGLLARQPAVVGELARVLGRLHRISRHLDLGDGAARGDADRLLRSPLASVHRLRRPSRRLLSRWQALRLKRSTSDFDRWILEVLPGIARYAERLATESIAPLVDASGMGIVHNDLNWENLIWDERMRVRAVIDFDNAAMAPWAAEVGSAAVVLVGTDPHTVEEFVSRYEAVSGAAVDRAVVRLTMEAKCVQSILNTIVLHLDGQGATPLRVQWCQHLYGSLGALSEL